MWHIHYYFKVIYGLMFVPIVKIIVIHDALKTCNNWNL